MIEEHVTLELRLPLDLVQKAEAILAERGSCLTDFIRMKLKGLVKCGRHFDLPDRMTFGKYKEECVKDIICTDPSYVHWCLREASGFSLTPRALDLLAEVDAGIGE